MNARITAAARALCSHSSQDTGMPEADNWAMFSQMFMEDAKIAVEAADAALPPAPPKPRKKHEMSLERKFAIQTSEIERLSSQKIMLESTLRIYRERHGPIGSA